MGGGKKSRDSQIKAWLDEYSDKYDIENFIIIDDNESSIFKEKYYKVYKIFGLMETDIDEIVNRLENH